VFQAFLTTFLVDSGYKTPIQNLDQLFSTGIKLAYDAEHNFVFENLEETEASNVQIHRVDCPSFEVCENWAIYQKNVSILLYDFDAETGFARGEYFGENSEPLLCRLDDGVYNSDGIAMIMLYGDPLLRRVSEIIDRVVAAGLYTFWVSKEMHFIKLQAEKVAIVNPLDGYYSFNLYHMQPAFYILLMGWNISTLCFILEVFYNRSLRKTN
jgi:hypothetical protein